MYLLDLLGYWIVMRQMVLVSLRTFSLTEEDLLDVRSSELLIKLVGGLLLQRRKMSELLAPEERQGQSMNGVGLLYGLFLLHLYRTAVHFIAPSCHHSLCTVHVQTILLTLPVNLASLRKEAVAENFVPSARPCLLPPFIRTKAVLFSLFLNKSLIFISLSCPSISVFDPNIITSQLWSNGNDCFFVLENCQLFLPLLGHLLFLFGELHRAARRYPVLGILLLTSKDGRTADLIFAIGSLHFGIKLYSIPFVQLLESLQQNHFNKCLEQNTHNQQLKQQTHSQEQSQVLSN